MTTADSVIAALRMAIAGMDATIAAKDAEIASLREQAVQLCEIVERKDAEIARLREALAPFAEIADHFPRRQTFGNRPWDGTIYAWHTSGFPDAELTVEHVHAARAALAPVEVVNG